jgi:hypothetical protein
MNALVMPSRTSAAMVANAAAGERNTTMAKKKESKTTKAKQPTKPSRRAPQAPKQPAAESVPEAKPALEAQPAPEGATGATTAAAPRERTRDPRLPPPGTVIEKRDRAGNLRCKVTVEEDGIHYNGQLYKSLSAATMAAAKDLGIGGRSQNGFTFFGLSKPKRPAADPIEALGRAWERYRERAMSVASAVTDEIRERVRDLFEEHAEAINDLREKVA